MQSKRVNDKPGSDGERPSCFGRYVPCTACDACAIAGECASTQAGKFAVWVRPFTVKVKSTRHKRTAQREVVR